jgi:hypothetical protein
MPPDSPRSLPHIYLPDHGAAEPYTSPRSGGGSAVPPTRNRAQHAAALEEALATALATAAAARVVPDPAVTAGTPGFYLEFELPAAQTAVVDKLEKRGRGGQIELVAGASTRPGRRARHGDCFRP